MEDRMQKFAALVAAGSFTAAARELHISQPALTVAVRKLERELQAELVVRGSRHLRLTPAGQLVHQAALEQQTTVENLQVRLAGLAGQRPAVAIGIVDSIAATLCGQPEPLNKLESDAEAAIIINSSRYLREAVRDHSLDMALVVEDTEANTGLEALSAGLEPFIVVCRPDIRATAEHEVRAGRLGNLISYDQASTTYRLLRQALDDFGLVPNVTLYSTSPDVMLHMVLRSRGVAILPYYLVRTLLGSGELAALHDGQGTITLRRPISLIRARGKLLSEPLQLFARQTQAALTALEQEFTDWLATT